MEKGMQWQRVSDKVEDIGFMIQFLNFAYNQKVSTKDEGMDNNEKTGGQLFFFCLKDKIDALQEEVYKLRDNK